jgi:hypothetical protein
MSAENDTQSVRTVEDYIFGCVNFAVSQETVAHIASERDIPLDMEKSVVGRDTLRLMKADLLKWIVLGAGKVNNTSDSDNGWSHSEGGYTLSKDDKKLLMDEANAIYEELEPESVFGKKKIRVHSRGIMPAMRDLDGVPLPRKIR